MYYPERDPYNKGGVNRGYDNGYPGEPRGRDNGYPGEPRGRDYEHPREPRGRDNGYPGAPRGRDNGYSGEPRGRGDVFRRSSRRPPTRVPYVQGDRYKPESDIDHVFNADMSEPRDNISMSPSGVANIGKGPIIPIVAFCLLLFLVLGAMAVGGVALYYAHFDNTPIYTYTIYKVINGTTFKEGMVLPSTDAFKTQETTFCKGVKAVFGDELKSCEVDFIHADTDKNANLDGRLHFYAKKLATAAGGYDTIWTFVQRRLGYDCLTQFNCFLLELTALPSYENVCYNLKSNISTATPDLEFRNNTRYYEAQKYVCDAIKTSLGKVYSLCVVKEDGDIILYVDANMLRDEFKKEPVTEKTMGAALQSKLAKLINEPGQKLTSFNDFVLKVDAGTC